MFCTGLLIGAITVVVTTGAAVVQPPTAAAAPTLPSGFVYRDQNSGQNAYDLTDFAYLPDGSVLTTGKSGRLAWAATDGRTRTLATLPVNAEGDIGLVSVAPAPDYPTSKNIYLIRSVPVAGGSLFRAARWTVTGATEPTGITGERTVLEFPVTAPYHGMTGLLPMPDGTLWISTGDSSSPGYVDPRAFRVLDLDAPEGKLFHLTADGLGAPDNPYYTAAAPDSVRSKVYARGFRSPFRLSIDATGGFPVVGDVGWNAWEELDVVRPGGNYGWPCWEGGSPTGGYAARPECAGVPNGAPLWTYQHGSDPAQGNSVTGGIVYTGTSYPEEYRGAYFFGDYSGNKLWTLRYDDTGRLTQPPQNPPLGMDIGAPVKFAAAPDGDIVYADIAAGSLRKLSYLRGNTAPVAKATTTTDPVTRTVTFDGGESVDFDGDSLTYFWEFGDGAVGTGVRTTHAYPGPERRTARLTVTDGLGATGSTSFVVAPSNFSPDVRVADPGDETFAVGEPITMTATGTDPEDGPLTVTWTSTVVHCPTASTCHAHPGLGGSGPSFSVPFTEHPDSRVEITASVTDSDNVTTSNTYAALPTLHRLTVTSDVPATVQIPSRGGASSALVVEGALVEVVAATTALDGTSSFTRWTDGPATASRQLTVGTGDVTLTADYRTPIDRRYDSESALRQLLGAPTGPEVTDVNGRHRPHQNGRMYWSQAGGVREVHGAILAGYLRGGGPGRYGMPATDETGTPDGVGRFNHFLNRASFYWTPATGAHTLCCQNRDLWAALGWERSYLGYPTTDESVTEDGVAHFSHFSNRGSIYWTPATGSQAICCQIREEWQRLGADRSYLGYPATSETRAPDGVGAFTHFTNAGSIYWAPWTGAKATCCQIREKWAAMGWERSYLGYPAISEQRTPDGVGAYTHYAGNGSIYWSPRTGAQATCCQIRDRWAALGWERSYLGYPASDEFRVPGGVRSNYERGYIFWRASDGAVFDQPY